jgi:tRNA (guanine-N7-)-methyltransferase
MHQKQPPEKTAVRVSLRAGAVIPTQRRIASAEKSFGIIFLRVDASVDYSSANSLKPAEVELIPKDYFARLDFAEIFSRTAPVELEIGCGDGTFLVARAQQFPERNFLGLERLQGRIRTCCKKAARAQLPNVRFLRIEAVYTCQYLLPAASIEMVHLLFPDPWPKSRHRRRRIVTPEFLATLRGLLEANGRFRIVTDQEKYFTKIRELVFEHGFREEESGENFPLTTFEKHYVAAGMPIYRLELRKVS